MAPGLPQGFGRAGSADAEDEVDGCVRVCSPGSVEGERSGACAGAKPVAHELVFEQERTAGAALVCWPFA
jgi:hypothetical protein